MTKKKVAIIGTNGLPPRYGGFETLANHLVLNLHEEFDFFVYCSKTDPKQKIVSYNGATLRYLPFSANGIQSIIYDMLSILDAWFRYDVLLVLGASGGLILPLRWLFKKKIILNFGGLDWKREKWNIFAQRFLKYSEAVAVKCSDGVIVDNRVFYDYVKAEYKKESKIIEYGGDHTLTSSNLMGLEKYGLQNKKYYLSVSRAQEDNYIHILLDAFTTTPDKMLAVISNWNTSEYGKALLQKYSGYKNILLINAVYDQADLDTIRMHAYCYIHTHSACGSAPSLIEAMYLGLPVISYDVPANRATTNNKAFYFTSSRELADIVSTISEDSLLHVKKEMKQYAELNYTWSIIAKKYRECILE